MNLHSDYPFWMISEGLKQSWPVLKESTKTDVLVIGGGITGALIADSLCKAGCDVVLAEKGHVAYGSTSASTALLQYEIDVPLHKLITSRGEKDATRAYQLCHDAIDTIEAMCQRFPAHAGFERHPSLWHASYKKHVDEILRPEFAARSALGFAVDFLSSSDIDKKFGFAAPAGILSEQAAQVNPYLMTHHLLQQASNKGARIFEQSEIVSLVPEKRRIQARTKAGVTISARYVIVAAGYQSQTFLDANYGTLHSTYAIISKPLPKKLQWHRNALIWETRDPYHYIRTTADNRIIVGGRDVPFQSPNKRDQLISRKSRELQQHFQTLLPSVDFDTDFAWAGTFGKTKDGLPYIGSRGHKRILYALGYGGNGITFSVIASNILKDRVLDRKNPDASIFSFER